MSIRALTAMLGTFAVAVFWVIRPDLPTAGSDCEVLSTGVLREPVAAISSLAIGLAGWFVVRHRTLPGVALILAGTASFTAHASAHPTARALDGVLAAFAVVAVIWSIVSEPPGRRRLAAGLVVGTVAIVVWVLTRSDAVLCDTVGPWGHATWHLLVAIAASVVLVPREA